MDEWTLNDLLECSVCLERLDTSSKVLPCQHTFCKKCLEEIVSTHKELRCPECRVLVDCRIDELPPNVLLMRILEGMRNNAGPKKFINVGNRTTQNIHVAPTCQTIQPVPVTVQQQQPPPSSPHIQTSDHVNVQQVKTLNYPTQPYARAVYDYLSNEPGDLNFRKGDIIMLHNRIDSNWCHGECEGVKGVFPLTYVQVMMPLPSHIPQCRALYDFRMTNDEEDGCLTFSKGEIITVIRRIDENWAEGKLLERVGIFPLAFVELNNVARALMKLSSNIQPGPSRVAPPTPTCEDTTPLIPTDHSHTISKPDCSPYHHDPFISTPHHQIPNTVTVQRITGNSDSSSTVSSSSSVTTPNTSSGSSSSTAPSSPTSSPPARTTYSQSNVTVSSSVVSTTSPPHAVQSREKRHSFSILHSGHHHPSNRHSAEILSPNESVKHEDQLQPQANGEMTGRHYRTSLELNSSQPPQQGSPRVSGCAAYLPAAYIALYPYKPQKADELELKKGSIYMVTERCQDGWFRGTSGRTQKCGVFPGNYVTPVKSLPSLQARGPPHGSSSGTSGNSALSPHSGVHHSDSRHSGSCSPRQRSILYGIGNLQVPPELPPRSCSPAQPLVSTSWHGQPQTEELISLGRSPSVVVSSDTTMATSSPASICTTVTPPTVVLGQTSSSSGKSSEKVKEKKEGKTGLMWRLASMKKCKSPPPATYSVDNPVFEDAVINPSPAHHVHVRSGSCPSQLLQVLPVDVNSAHHRLFGTGSQRLKHKERPAIITTHLASSGRTPGEVNAAACVPPSHHRKSNSLDASCIEMVKKGNKQPSLPLRERFRCIVPYPPNSEYELELRVGDIIHVHKKREDGWYKGTQQRTGRTGLFPASFVESY